MNFKTLSSFALNEKLSDFKLILPESMGKKTLPVHKIILASNSDFFSKFFEENTELNECNI